MPIDGMGMGEVLDGPQPFAPPMDPPDILGRTARGASEASSFEGRGGGRWVEESAHPERWLPAGRGMEGWTAPSAIARTVGPMGRMREGQEGQGGGEVGQETGGGCMGCPTRVLDLARHG